MLLVKCLIKIRVNIKHSLVLKEAVDNQNAVGNYTVRANGVHNGFRYVGIATNIICRAIDRHKPGLESGTSTECCTSACARVSIALKPIKLSIF